MKKLPLGIQHFDQLVERGCIYVDKTQQIHQLLIDFKAAFLSRPRRFGKSLLLSTIAQLYSGKRELFKGLWIEDQWDWTKKHPVIHFYMDRTGFKDWGLRTGLNKHLDLIAVEHEVELKEESPAFRLSELVEKLYQKYQRRVVVLFDEYDKPMLDVLHLPEEAEKNRQILGDFYGILKPIGDKIEFLMLTGISKFSQVSVFSKLNHLEDITFHRRFSTLTGYTQEEVENNFAEYLQEVGQYQELSHEDLLKQIKYWYNGYTWDLKHYVYNPVSLMRFCSQGVFINHWFATGTPEFLIQELKKQHIYAPESAEINQLMFESYTLENLDPILLLFQTGYLTLRERLPNGFMRLDYPNHEVRSAFMEHLMAGYGHVSKLTPGPTVWKLREAFFKNDHFLTLPFHTDPLRIPVSIGASSMYRRIDAVSDCN